MLFFMQKKYSSPKGILFLLVLVGIAYNLSYSACDAKTERKFSKVQALIKQVSYSAGKGSNYADITLGTEATGTTQENTVASLSSKEAIEYIAGATVPLEFIILVNDPNINPILISGNSEKISDSELRIKYISNINEQQKQSLQKAVQYFKLNKAIGNLIVKGSSNNYCNDPVLNPTNLFAKKGMEINKNLNPKNGWDDWKLTFRDISNISIINRDAEDKVQSLEEYSKYWVSCTGLFKSANGNISFTEEKSGKVLQLNPVLSNPVFDTVTNSVTFDAHFMKTYELDPNKTIPPEYPEELKKTGHFSLEKPLNFMLLRIVTTGLTDPEFVKLTREHKH